jgi:hypothetical protein
MKPGLLNMPEGLGENRAGEPMPIGPFVRNLIDVLDQQHVLWAVLRNAEELPDFTRYDIDVLTLPRHLDAVIQAVESCAEQTGWRIAGRIKKHRYTCLMLLKKTEQGVFYLPIDLFTALEFRGVSYLSAEEVLHKRDRTAKGGWTLPAGTAAAIMLLKEWLPHGDLNERKRQQIQSVLRTDPESFVAALKAAAGPGWTERIRRGDWALSAADRKALRRAVRRGSPRWLAGRVRSAVANILHLFRPSLGRVVCLAGADGSGKTTLAQGLAENTFKRPFKGCRYIHGNIGVLPRFRDMRKALGIGKASDEPAAEPQELQGMMEPIPAWKSVLLASYYAVDFCLARLLICRWRGQWLLTVMDRSFYDYYYQLGHRNCPQRVLNLLSALIPKPDLLLCIEGDAESIHARKPELTVEEIRTEQEILRSLSARLPFGRMLNGCGGIEAMIGAGAEEIFQCLEKQGPAAPSGAPLPAVAAAPPVGPGSPVALRFRILEIGGRPVAAVPVGSRTWHLFPATSLKRRLTRDAMRILAGVGLDRAVCASRDSVGDLISQEEIEFLVNRLTESCGGEKPDWLLSWPARMERQRMYLIFRCTSQNMSGVVKIGAGDFNRSQFANEADVLRRLAGTALPFSVPSVLFELNPDENRAVLALGNFPCSPARVSGEEAAGAGRQVITALKQRVGGLIHGDLGAANMLRAADGRLFVLDWENASDQAPSLTDTIALWISSRQKQILKSPDGEIKNLSRDFAGASGEELQAALLFLDAHDNLAARNLLGVWPASLKEKHSGVA